MARHWTASPISHLLPNHKIRIRCLTANEGERVLGRVRSAADAPVSVASPGVSRICTRDTDFHRFPFLSVVDPLRSGIGSP